MATWISSNPLHVTGVGLVHAGEPVPPHIATDAFLRGAVGQVELTPEEHRRIYGEEKPIHGDVEQSPAVEDHADETEQGEGDQL